MTSWRDIRAFMSIPSSRDAGAERVPALNTMNNNHHPIKKPPAEENPPAGGVMFKLSKG